MKPFSSLLLVLAVCGLSLLPGSDLAGQEAPEFVPLFNGKDLTGWKQFTGKPVWKVEDGLLVCEGDGGGWIGTEKEYGDFEVQLEYKLKPGGNSGVYIRAPQKGHISRDGIEIQLLDDLHPRYSKLDFFQYTGSVYHVVAPARRATKPAGQWNTISIRAQGRDIKVWLNGKKIIDADLNRWLQDPAIAREHTGLLRSQGHIGLQSHTDRIEYRNLRVRELKSSQ